MNSTIVGFSDAQSMKRGILSLWVMNQSQHCSSVTLAVRFCLLKAEGLEAVVGSPVDARQTGKILGFWETYREDAMCAWSPDTPQSAASSELFELPPSIFVVCMRMETLIPQSTKSHHLTQNPENWPYKCFFYRSQMGI